MRPVPDHLKLEPVPGGPGGPGGAGAPLISTGPGPKKKWVSLPCPGVRPRPGDGASGRAGRVKDALLEMAKTAPKAPGNQNPGFPGTSVLRPSNIRNSQYVRHDSRGSQKPLELSKPDCIQTNAFARFLKRNESSTEGEGSCRSEPRTPAQRQRRPGAGEHSHNSLSSNVPKV
eukprot:gene13633-biopygen20054